jgi:hypothetical protein
MYVNEVNPYCVVSLHHGVVSWFVRTERNAIYTWPRCSIITLINDAWLQQNLSYLQPPPNLHTHTAIRPKVTVSLSEQSERVPNTRLTMIRYARCSTINATKRAFNLPYYDIHGSTPAQICQLCTNGFSFNLFKIALNKSVLRSTKTTQFVPIPNLWTKWSAEGFLGKMTLRN